MNNLENDITSCGDQFIDSFAKAVVNNPKNIVPEKPKTAKQLKKELFNYVYSITKHNYVVVDFHGQNYQISKIEDVCRLDRFHDGTQLQIVVNDANLLQQMFDKKFEYIYSENANLNNLHLNKPLFWSVPILFILFFIFGSPFGFLGLATLLFEILLGLRLNGKIKAFKQNRDLVLSKRHKELYIGCIHNVSTVGLSDDLKSYRGLQSEKLLKMVDKINEQIKHMDKKA